MPARVSVGNGKYCYTGPTCKLHAAHWERAAEAKLDHAREVTLAAQTFDEFQHAKALQTEAQAEYDLTGKGFVELTAALAAEPGQTDLQDRFHTAEQAIAEQATAAVNDFVAAQDADERAEDVFATTDREKLALYAQDPDANVRANLALNPAASVAQLQALAHEQNERIQANVTLNTKTPATTLRHLSNNGASNYVKVLAKARLVAVKSAKEQAAEDARAKQTRAASYSSYSYRGKGGGK